jgi:fructose-bisphosphate aldolase, class II
MSRITLRQLLDHAAEHGYGVPAFNINNMEQALAIGEAASKLEAPSSSRPRAARAPTPTT